MKRKLLNPNWRLRSFLTSFLLFLLLISSCRKEDKQAVQIVISPEIEQAKSWYESTYPINANTDGNKTILSVKSKGEPVVI